MIALELLVVLGAVIVLGTAVARRSRVAPPVVLLLLGVALGAVPALRAVHLPPQLMLLVFLPALLYWESSTVSLRDIRANLRGIVLSSTLLVVVTAWAVAATAHAFGVPWGPAWVLGAAVAPTDATAVGALARALPRRTVTVLRAESLVNDGTALVVYAVAVGVTVGSERLSAVHVPGLFALAYVGGIGVGALVAWLGVLARRRVGDPLLGNTVTVLIPFSAYLAAEVVHASGVLAVVVCGLVTSQVGPRIDGAESRSQSTAFWTLATFLLNGALFVLIGIEAHSAVRSLVSTDLLTALVAGAAVYGVILVVRFTFLVVSAYTIRAVDRRPSQRLRRVTNRSRLVSTVAGFRGAVSLAAVLAVPTTTASGAPFPERDLLVFVTAGVVATTLVVQGLALPLVTRFARLHPDDEALEAERLLADRTATEEALAAIATVATELGVGRDVADRVRTEYFEHLLLLMARGAPGPEAEPTVRLEDEGTALRRALLDRKRTTVIRLRDERRIDDAVLRQVQARLDIEELRLERGRLALD